MRASLAPGTRATYATAVALFRRWRTSRALLPDAPITAYDCALWLTHLALTTRLTAATLGVYLSALSTTWEEERHPDDESRSNPTRAPVVRRVLKGIANERAVRHREAPPPDRTPALTYDVLSAYQYDTHTRRDVMLRAAAMLGVAAALRPSELLGSPRYPERALTCGQLTFFADEMCTRVLSPASLVSGVPRALKLRLHITKTSQLVSVEKVVSLLPAVAAVWRWCRHRGAAARAPLFHCDGRALNTNMLVGDLNRRHRATALLPLVSPYTGKCLRSGGAGTLAMQGAPGADIAALGWAPDSNQWEVYASDPRVQHARRVVMNRLMQHRSPSSGEATAAAAPSRRI